MLHVMTRKWCPISSKPSLKLDWYLVWHSIPPTSFSLAWRPDVLQFLIRLMKMRSKWDVYILTIILTCKYPNCNFYTHVCSYIGGLRWWSHFTFVTFKNLFFPLNCHYWQNLTLVILAKFHFFIVNNMASSRFPKDQCAPQLLELGYEKFPHNTTEL